MLKLQNLGLYLLVVGTFTATLTSCSTRELVTENVDRQLITYDMSEPLPQNSGLKVNLTAPTAGLLFQPAKEPVQVSVAPGTYVLQGVNVYIRMSALLAAYRQFLDELPDDKKAEAEDAILTHFQVFLAAQKP